ncbi:MAG: cysteine desulfurase family protein [Oscillospiraceae bacterium]
MQNNKIDLSTYFDNSSTTFVSKDVADTIYETFLNCDGNPSSLYDLGIRSENLISSAKKTIANAIDANEDEIFFTSGGTEANNLAIIGVAQAYQKRKIKIISSKIEHHSVIDCVKFLENTNFETVLVAPKENGELPFDEILKTIDNINRHYLFSFMLINNETGLITDIEKLCKLIKQKAKNVIIHCDCVSAFGKYPISIKKLGVDILTISAHKIHGPKGVGAIYIKKSIRVVSRNIGGMQQKGIRAGTEPVALIAGFEKATSNIMKNINENIYYCTNLKNEFLKLIKDENYKINSIENSSCYILNLSTLKINSETMLHFLEEKGFYISSGSACSKGKKSHVLEAMNLQKN